MRVATFNVHHCEGRDGVIDIKRIADVIVRTKASLVALQELDQGMDRSGRVDQPHALQELTGLTVHFFPTLRRGGGRFGVGLASGDHVEAELQWLPHEEGEEPRGVIVARWQGTSIVASHLSTDPTARFRQTRALAQTARAQPPPTLLLGDLNQTTATLSPLAEAGFSWPSSPEPTFGWHLWRRQIDFVLAGPGLRVASWSTLPSDASDHLALSAVVEPVS